MELTGKHFAKLGIDTPRLDAEVLLADLLGVERIHLYTNYQKPLNKEEVDRYRQRVIKRSRGIPVAYITKKKEFMSLPFKIRECVLIPRPETELLVEKALDILQEKGAERIESKVAERSRGLSGPSYEMNGRFRVADLGTGSGVIALSLAYYLPGLEVYGTDISPGALKLAAENCRELGIEGVTLLQGSYLEPLVERGIMLDGVISNPPYIPSEELAGLQKELSYEPREALDGGKDGLKAYRQIAAGLQGVLKNDGFVLLEIGHNQEEAVTSILQDAGYSYTEVFPDLAGLPRMVLARTKKE